MFKRFLLALASLAAAAAFISSVGAAPAAAASPWWQILDGSRPSNLWEPTDSVQEIDATRGPSELGEGTVQQLEVNGEVVACLADQSFLGEFGCFVFYGKPAVSTAEQLEAALEPVYGSDVEVSGGPVAVAPLIVTVPGRSVPPISFYVPTQEEKDKEEAEATFGTASSKVISLGGSGHLIVTLTNLGSGPIDGAGDMVKIVDDLPEGVIATGYESFAGQRDAYGPITCEIEESGTRVSCTFENELPSYESLEVDIFASLVGEPPTQGAPGTITVSGGGAPEESGPQEVNVSPEEVSFGIERFSAKAEEEGGDETVLAGKHPFQLTTTLQFNAGDYQGGASRSIVQPAQPRNLRFTLPVGLVGNTQSVPQCTLADFYDGSRFLTNQCPDDTAIGVAATTIVEKTNVGFARLGVPLFNLVPGEGEPARLGLTAGGVSVVIDTEVDPDNDYRIIATVRNTTQLAQLLSATVTIWGTPGDPEHDAQRGWLCAYHYQDLGPCSSPSGATEDAFLRLPVNCVNPSETEVEVEPWNTPPGALVAKDLFSTPPLGGCAQVPFKPSIHAKRRPALQRRDLRRTGQEGRGDPARGGDDQPLPSRRPGGLLAGAI